MLIKKAVIFMACAAALLVLLAACSCTGGSGNLHISVTDTDGSPIWGAKVVSESQPAGQLKISGLTAEEVGGVDFGGIKSGDYVLQVSRYGYAPETVAVKVTGGNMSVTVKLFYASPPPVS